MLSSFALDDNQTAPSDSTPLKPLDQTDPSRTTQPIASAIRPLSPLDPGRSTNPLPPVSSPLPGTNPPRSTQPGSSASQPLPGLPSQYALSLLKQGKTPQQAVDATNAAYNLQTGQQAVYYGNNNTIGLADGYYLAGPTFGNGMADWSPVARGNESAGASGGPDLTGLLTSLLSRFSAQPTNTIAALPAPVAPAVAPAASSPGMPTNPYTGLPMFSQNPVTGAITTNAAGVSSPFDVRTPPSDLGGVRTQSVNTGTPVGGPVNGGPVTGAPPAPAPAPALPTDLSGNPIPGGGSVDPTTGVYTPPAFVSNGGNPQPTAPPPDMGAAAQAAMQQALAQQQGVQQATAGSPGSTGGNPFTDPTQMALWEAVQAALSQAQQPPGNNPQTAALYAAINNIAQQLQGPAFTDQQLNNIRTASMDSIQRDQDNAIQAEIQRQGLLGQSPTSGTVTDAVNKIKNSYTQLRGQAQQANNIYELNTIDQRRQELLQALNLGATTATGNSQLGFGNAVTGAEISTLPVTAENNALQNALGVTNAANPSLLLSSIMSIINSNNSQGNINAGNNAALAQQIGQFLSGLV